VPTPALPPPKARRRPPLIGTVVYGVWIALTIALVWLVASYGDNLPGPDEWHLVPIWVGKAPLTWSYLFSRHNEHILPLSREFLIALARITHGDFRAGMFASVLILSAAAFALIRAASRIRGRPSLADIALPLLLLHLGHRQNVLQGWNVHNALFAGVAIAILLLLLDFPSRFAKKRTIALGLLLILLAYTGAAGHVVSVILCLWLLLYSLLARLSLIPDQRSAANAGALLACAGLANDRWLLGFDSLSLEAAVPWLLIVLGTMLCSRLLGSRLARTAAGLVIAALAIALTWLTGLEEAVYEAIALLACLWAAYKGVLRYRHGGRAARADGLIIVGLSLTSAWAIIVFRHLDRDCVWMMAGCATLSLAAWSLVRIRRLSGRIGALAAFVILTLITLGSNRGIAPPSPSLWATLRGAIMFLSTGFGLTATWHWPYSGWAIVLVWLAAAIVLVRASRTGKQPGLVRGLIPYLTAFTALALVVGWGRAGFEGNPCLEQRYAILSLPFLCAAYLVLEIAPAPAGKAAQFLLTGIVLFWSWDNFRDGVADARYVHEKNRRFMEDMSAGKPLMYVIHHHRWWVPQPWSLIAYNEMETGMGLLHDAGKPGFAQMSLGWPSFEPRVVFDATNRKTQGIDSHAEASEGAVSIRLGGTPRVYAILVRFEPLGEHVAWQRSMVRIHWPGGPPSGEDIELCGLPGDLTACAWVDRPIDQFTVDWYPVQSLRVTRIGYFVASDVIPFEFGIRNPFFRFR
jgi:hypothetical protein